MAFTGLATKTYRGPIDIVWANSIQGNDDYLYTGVAKAWVMFDGSAATPSARASSNISSITDNAVGIWTLNFTTAFTSTAYCVAFGGKRTDAAPHNSMYINTAAAGSLKFGMVNDPGSPTDVDGDRVCVAVIGQL